MTENNNSVNNETLLPEQEEKSPIHSSGNPIIGWIVRLLKGLLAGIGAITPGLSAACSVVLGSRTRCAGWRTFATNSSSICSFSCQSGSAA